MRTTHTVVHLRASSARHRILVAACLGPLAVVLGCTAAADDAGSELAPTSSTAAGTTATAAPDSTPGNTAGPSLDPVSPLPGNTNDPAAASSTPAGPSSPPSPLGTTPATNSGSGEPTSGNGGTTSGAGGASTNPDATGGAAGSAETGAGGNGLGSSGAGGSDTAGGGTAGTGSAGAANAGAAGSNVAEPEPDPGPVVPPVRDTDSEVPISNAGGGYTVEGNYAYGPLTAQRLDVIYPNGEGPEGTELRPVVLMFHGGGWIHSYTNNYGSGKDHMSTFFNRFLAHGYIVCNAEYRVADDTPDGALAPGAVEDALLAAKWCWDNMEYFHGDRSRFVVTGASAGGHLALMVGMATAEANLGPTHPADFNIAAIVDGYGIADVESLLTQGGFTAQWIPASLPDRAAVARAVNPMTYVRADIPPLIVVQGSEDNAAPVGDSRRMVELLVAAGADATMHEVPGAGHGFATPASAWPDAEQAMFEWLTAQGISE